MGYIISASSIPSILLSFDLIISAVWPRSLASADETSISIGLPAFKTLLIEFSFTSIP
jgi:hypothetical protein